ncbi:NDP-hexose 2,3-dehydratase family protein [Streptosporangium sp. DT93]|uniref:NDP-hexose 2,3-dehydratase family protein n=1 Tax=Streptosporangium sp. DT93 TaxID=3393428 RepID=UPI003CFA2546
MTELTARPDVLLRTRDHALPIRIAQSALADEGSMMSIAEFRTWFGDRNRDDPSTTRKIPFDELAGWSVQPGTGNLVHDSGKFFVIEGLRVRTRQGPVGEWSQPIINQPEIGILGILIKEFDGVLHCLMQSKMEPGNCNGLQLSPTVQATWSNYTRVHKGSPVPYLDYFVDADRHRVVTDVLQSEQGSWFYRKRNRNMIVEVTEDVELLDGFCWLTIGQLHRLLSMDDMINMDSRTVLSCLPFSGSGLATTFPFSADPFRSALMRSVSEDHGALHTNRQILSWITESRTRYEIRTDRIDLAAVEGWRRTEDRISHEDGRYFDIIAVDVRAHGREVGGWTQPMIEPHRIGVIAFVIKEISGVLHVLVNARVEAGYLDVVELAPTVQCTPENYEHLPEEALPPFLTEVLTAPPSRIRFDSVHSEEGGRFYHARNRYMAVEAPPGIDLKVPPGFRWMTLHQLVSLMQHSHYVNVQARNLTACMYSLAGGSGGTRDTDR